MEQLSQRLRRGGDQHVGDELREGELPGDDVYVGPSAPDEGGQRDGRDPDFAHGRDEGEDSSVDEELVIDLRIDSRGRVERYEA